jgi:transketolase
MNNVTASKDEVVWYQQTRQIAQNIRCRVLEHTLANNGGYLSQACSSAEILATLYTRIMKLGPSQAPMIPPPFPGVPAASNIDYFTGAAYNGPQSAEYDRFFLSPVHYSLVLYATLVEVGRMAPEGLLMFNQDGSTVEMIGAEHSPGLELMSGSLGQGLSQAAGIAWARKRRADTGRVWVFMSDGEFQIGQTWEAMEIISFYRLGNLGIYVDVNGQSADGKMSTVLDIEPLDKRLEAFGAHTLVVDAHDPQALAAASVSDLYGRALVVLAYSNPCQGIPLLEQRRPKLHYVRFKDAEEQSRYQAFLDAWGSN